MCYLDYGGILSRQWEWVHKWSSSVWVATYRVLLTMPTEQSQWRPAMPPFLLSLNPGAAAFSQIPGVRNNMGFYIHFHSAPAPLNQLCVRVSPTFHYIWLKLVYMCFVFVWHMPFGQQIQWFSRISFQKSWTNVNFTKKLITSPESAVEKIFQS